MFVIKKLLFVVCALMSLSAFAQSGPLNWPNQYARVTTNTTATLKTGPGTLAHVTVGVVGTTSAVIFYDNTAASGTVIANLTTTGLQTFTLNAAFSTGLTYTTSGGSAADISISYK